MSALQEAARFDLIITDLPLWLPEAASVITLESGTTAFETLARPTALRGPATESPVQGYD